jgi:hypothetical protein
MCLTVFMPNNEEIETCGELIRILGGTLVKNSIYPDDVEIRKGDCLCPIDIEATAKKFGYECKNNDDGFSVAFSKK